MRKVKKNKILGRALNLMTTYVNGAREIADMHTTACPEKKCYIL